jgi:hypothetical protein
MPVRVPELATRIDHPPRSWQRHGESRQLPQRDGELATLGLAILMDAGIQCSHGTPTTEAAAPTVDAASVTADPELGMGISKLPAAQRCDDDTVAFQRAWPPRGSTHHQQRWCPQAVGAPGVLRRSLRRPIMGRQCEPTRSRAGHCFNRHLLQHIRVAGAPAA